MALTALRRRTAMLEKVFVLDPVAGYPPLMMEEIEAAGAANGKRRKWTEVEKARVINQGPYRHSGARNQRTQWRGRSQAVYRNRSVIDVNGRATIPSAGCLRLHQVAHK